MTKTNATYDTTDPQTKKNYNKGAALERSVEKLLRGLKPVFFFFFFFFVVVFCVCVEVLRPSQPNGVMSSAVSLPNHTFTGQA